MSISLFSKIRKGAKIHEDKSAPDKFLTDRIQQALLESFWMLQGAAYEMEKLGWILGALAKNEIH